MIFATFVPVNDYNFHAHLFGGDRIAIAIPCFSSKLESAHNIIHCFSDTKYI